MSIKVTKNCLYFKGDDGKFHPISMVGSGADKTLKEIQTYANTVKTQASTDMQKEATRVIGTIPSDYTALSNQVSSLSGEIDNQLDVVTMPLVGDSYVTTNGAIQPYTGWKRTDYIPCSGFKFLKCSDVASTSDYNVFFGANKEFISNFHLPVGSTIVPIPDNAVYFMLSNNNDSMDATVCKVNAYNLTRRVNDFTDLDIGTINPLYTDWLRIYGNLFNGNVTDNIYINQLGQEAEAQGWATTGFIPINPALKYSAKSLVDGVWKNLTNIYVGIYNGNKEWIFTYYGGVTTDALAEYTLPDNARYIRISEESDKINGALVVAEKNYILYTYDYRPEGWVAKNIYPELSGQYDIALPAYYKNHVSTKNAAVNALMDKSRKCEAFIFLTDMHLRENMKSSAPIIKSILANTHVQFGINGGDTISSYPTEDQIKTDAEDYDNWYGFANLYYCRGNHDMWGKHSEGDTTGFTAPSSMVYNRFFRKMESLGATIESGKTYYYVDRPATKTRIIVTDNNEIVIPSIDSAGTYSQNCTISQEQINWFVDTLKNTPTDYAIVVVGHRPIATGLPYYANEALIFGDIITAYNKKSKINKTDSYGIKANVDFSNAKAKVVLVLCGHGHTDAVYKSDDGCAYYECSCDSWINNGQNTYAKHTHSTSENTVDVIVIDRETGKIHRIRYGANGETDIDLN